MQPQELNSDQFTAARYAPLFIEITREGGKAFNCDHFFSTWKQAMDLGLARVWAISDTAALGAFFTKDLFSGELRTSISFWFAALEVRHTGVSGKLMEAFENAAKEAGAVDIQAAAHEKWAPVRRAHQHEQHGFRKSETIFCKTL